MFDSMFQALFPTIHTEWLGIQTETSSRSLTTARELISSVSPRKLNFLKTGGRQ